ncbi:hypothetical protein NIES4074_04690 [Cylindrospermum sp. NIES-4074]|nr:hypothetical protein NIES4074_04690 [Cylindrospermum sp. NIES-4074]
MQKTHSNNTFFEFLQNFRNNLYDFLEDATLKSGVSELTAIKN